MADREPIFAMLSDRGQVRRQNEDACAAAPLFKVFVVCDGMGGAAGGEVASHLAAEAFVSYLSQNGVEDGLPPSRVRSRVNSAVQVANRAVYQQSVKASHLSGMGTTLVGLLHSPAKVNGSLSPGQNIEQSSRPSLWLVHVGDSRCYRWRSRNLEQLTVDHSLVEEQVRAGQITPAQALESPMRNVITRAVGTQITVDPEINGYCPQQGDLYLLASDGLTRELADPEIADILSRVPAEITQAALYEACRDLVEAANQKGGNDNITVLLFAPGPCER